MQTLANIDFLSTKQVNNSINVCKRMFFFFYNVHELMDDIQDVTELNGKVKKSVEEHSYNVFTNLP